MIYIRLIESENDKNLPTSHPKAMISVLEITAEDPEIQFQAIARLGKQHIRYQYYRSLQLPHFDNITTFVLV
jgi:hypothetical protein